MKPSKMEMGDGGMEVVGKREPVGFLSGVGWRRQLLWLLSVAVGLWHQGGCVAGTPVLGPLPVRLSPRQGEESETQGLCLPETHASPF